MQNHRFNTPTTLPPALKRRKDELSAELDALKRAGQLHYSQHTKAILAIRHARSLEELEQISAWYNPKPKAA